MNWMGGARKRIKLQESSRKQREFFEKVRFQSRLDRLRVEKNRTSTESQDMIFLEMLMNHHDKNTGCVGNVANRENQVNRVDLRSANSDIQLPMSPITEPSRLQLQDDETFDVSTEPQSSSNSTKDHTSSHQTNSMVSEDFQEYPETPRSILIRHGTPHPAKRPDRRVLFQEVHNSSHDRTVESQSLLWDLDPCGGVQVKREVAIAYNDENSPIIIMDSDNSSDDSNNNSPLAKSSLRHYSNTFIQTWQESDRLEKRRQQDQRDIIKEVAELSSTSELNFQEPGCMYAKESDANPETRLPSVCYGSLKPKLEVPEFEDGELVTISDSSSPTSPKDSSVSAKDDAYDTETVDIPYVQCKVEINEEHAGGEEEEPNCLEFVAEVPCENVLVRKTVLCESCRNRMTTDKWTQTGLETETE